MCKCEEDKISEDTINLIRGALLVIDERLLKKIGDANKYKGFHTLMDVDNHNAGFKITFKYPVFSITAWFITFAIVLKPYDMTQACQVHYGFRKAINSKEKTDV